MQQGIITTERNTQSFLVLSLVLSPISNATVFFFFITEEKSNCGDLCSTMSQTFVTIQQVLTKLD